MRRSILLMTACLMACSSDPGSGSTSLSAGSGAGDDAAGDTSTEDGGGESTGATGASDDSSGTEDDGGFVDADMDAPSCGAECDIWTVGDCPEGEKCTSVDCEGADNAWDSTVCRPLEGAKLAGDDCVGSGASPGLDGYDDCGEGLMCWDIDSDTGQGYCIPFCSGSAEAPTCDAGLQCQVWHDGTLPICVSECDPFLSGTDCQSEGNLCVPGAAGGGFVCVLDASGGAGPVGTGCDFNNTCNAGLVCASADFVSDCTAGTWGCCTEICDINVENTCSIAGAECVAWFEDPIPPGYEAVGACGQAL
jgi:hypothetical protein